MNNKYQLIDWLEKELMLTYPSIEQQSMNKFRKTVASYDFDSLYRVANMVDRFGFEAVFEGVGLK